MKTTKILVILLLIFVLSLIGAGVSLAATGGFQFDQERSDYIEKINETKTESMENITHIKIDTSSVDVEIKKYQETDIKVEMKGEYFALFSKRKQELNVSSDSNVLTIEAISQGFGIMMFSEMELTVYIPETFDQDLTINSSSADVELNQFSLNKVKLTSSSGDLTLNDTSFVEADLEASSGDIRVENTTGDLTVNTSSGDLTIKHNGDLFQIDVTTSSGDVRIYLKETSDFYLDARTSSGDIVNKFPITIVGSTNDEHLEGQVGDGTNGVEISTSSGDIYIGY